MDGLAAAGFVFGLMGVVAFVRLEKLVKTLKEKGVLDDDYKDELKTLKRLIKFTVITPL